ncbi:MAG: hypothetical protein IJV36_02495 [Prevotella sp.]|nr:hypothetical protein [Prevotella sp.]
MPGSNGKSSYEDIEKGQEQSGQTTPTVGTSATSIVDNEGGAEQASGYDEIISSINKELDDMKKKRREEEKIDAVVAAINGIGDIGSALGNIYAANHYVPSTYDPKNAVSAKYADRAAKARAEYDKNRTAMMNYLHKAQEQKQTFNFNQQKQELAQKKWEAEEERKNALNQAKVESYNAMTKYREAIANKNEAQAKQYEEQVVFLQAKMKYLELGYNLKQAESQARIDAQEALAEQRRREAEGTTTETTIERDRFGNETGRTVTKKPGGGNAADGGGASGGQKKSNPMGGASSSGGKKKNPMS